MSRTVISYCSAAKRPDPGVLPAIERYLSPRLTSLHQQATAQGEAFHILSGEFGLLAPTDPIPHYDHLLLPEEVSKMAARIASQLEANQITEVVYHTADPSQIPQLQPYLDAITQAAGIAGCAMQMVILNGDPV